MASVLALSGCNVLAKLKKKKPLTDPDGSDPSTASTSAFGDVDAFNKGDVSRFTDEVRLSNEAAFVRVIAFARTAPDTGGTLVGVVDPDTLVLKHARRFGNTLITFNRAAFPGKRFLGWVPDAAFLSPVTGVTPATAATATAATATTTTATAATATGAATTAATTTPVATTPTITGTGSSGSGGTGTCSMTLRTTGFTPSKATCSFNENVRAGSPATLTFPCSGGSASARFSSQTFSGSADRGRVAITNSSTSTFSGCQVRTTQTITGTPPNLSYFLSESLVGGSCKGVSTCTARATITAAQSP